MRALARRVDPEEDVPAEDEDVAQHGAREAHGDDVAQAREVAEPGGLGSGPSSAIHMLKPNATKPECCSACTAAWCTAPIVEVGQVPEIEVERPQRERDRRMGEHAQAIEEADPQDGREHRSRQARGRAAASRGRRRSGARPGGPRTAGRPPGPSPSPRRRSASGRRRSTRSRHPGTARGVPASAWARSA